MLGDSLNSTYHSGSGQSANPGPFYSYSTESWFPVILREKASMKLKTGDNVRIRVGMVFFLKKKEDILTKPQKFQPLSRCTISNPFYIITKPTTVLALLPK